MMGYEKGERAFGCFFLLIAFLIIAMVVAILAIIFTGIDLAYENWG
jgi:ABC-type multidrug transport system permease subunit